MNNQQLAIMLRQYTRQIQLITDTLDDNLEDVERHKHFQYKYTLIDKEFNIGATPSSHPDHFEEEVLTAVCLDPLYELIAQLKTDISTLLEES